MKNHKAIVHLVVTILIPIIIIMLVCQCVCMYLLSCHMYQQNLSKDFRTRKNQPSLSVTMMRV